MRFLVSCLLLSLAACSMSDVDFSVDNPSDAPMSIRIDGKEITVAAQGEQSVSLKAGRHVLEAPLTGKVDFIVFADSKGGIINPSFQPYFIVSEVYATNDNTAESFRPLKATLKVDGVEFEGPIQMRDDLFIDQSWSYGVHKDFPDTIRVGHDSKGNIQSKIFSKSAFIRYYETETKSLGDYDKTHQAVIAPQAHYPGHEALPVFQDAEMEAQAAKLKTLYQRYLQSDNADEQTELRKSYTPLITAFSSVYASKASKAPVEENLKYNHLIEMVGAALGSSARVIESGK